jgi:flavin-dependent dehydrogenase
VENASIGTGAPPQYDLIVAGAGPAGSACAITAARTGARVLLLEKDRFPRHKVCGEFVSSESLGLLRSLLEHQKIESLGAASRPWIASARVFLGEKPLTLPIVPPAQSIPRFELDAALFDSARREGVQAQEDVTVRAVEQNGWLTVRTEDSSFTARAVVNATGRWSQLTQYAVPGKTKWIGLKAHFREAAPANSTDLYFFPGGYCGVQPVEKDTINACAMVQAGLAKSWEEVFARHCALWRRSRDWEMCSPEVTTSPLYFRKPETQHRGMILVGDSAGFIDPFAGDGISLALNTGTLAAQCLTAFLEARCSWNEAHRKYRALYFKHLAPAFRNAAGVRVLLSAPSWLRSGLVRLVALPPIACLIVKRTRAKTAGGVIG